MLFVHLGHVGGKHVSRPLVFSGPGFVWDASLSLYDCSGVMCD